MAKQDRFLVSIGSYDNKGFFVHERMVFRTITSKKRLVRYKNKRYIISNEEWKYAVLEPEIQIEKKFKTSFNYDIHNYETN